MKYSDLEINQLFIHGCKMVGCFFWHISIDHLMAVYIVRCSIIICVYIKLQIPTAFSLFFSKNK